MARLLKPGKEIDGVQYQGLGLHLIDGVLQPYEETFEVELAGDFNVTVDFDVFDEEELSRDQFAQVVAKGGDVAGELFGGFFKGDEDARFAMLDRTADEELDGKEGFAASRATADEGGTAAGKAAAGDFIKAADAAGAFPWLRGWRTRAAGGSDRGSATEFW